MFLKNIQNALNIADALRPLFSDSFMTVRAAAAS